MKNESYFQSKIQGQEEGKNMRDCESGEITGKRRESESTYARKDC